MGVTPVYRDAAASWWAQQGLYMVFGGMSVENIKPVL
jgi:hypothetical protein